MLGDSRGAKAAGDFVAWRGWISIRVVVQIIHYANENWYPIPAHERWSRIDSVVAPNRTATLVLAARMEDMFTLAYVQHVKQFRRELNVIARVALLMSDNPLQRIHIGRESVFPGNLWVDRAVWRNAT